LVERHQGHRRRLPRLVAGRQRLGAVVVAVLDDEIFKQERRGGGAPALVAGEDAEAVPPQQVALEVVAEQARRPEEGVDALAVGGTRTGAVTVPGVRLARRHPLRGGPPPQDVAVRRADADHVALVAVLARGGQKDVPAPDDRRGVAAARQLGPPEHGALFAPGPGPARVVRMTPKT